MIPIHGGLMRQNISYKDMAKVARGAQEKVIYAVEDHTLDMSLCEKVWDFFLHGKSKCDLLALINEFSRRTVQLEMENEKPSVKRDQEKIKNYLARNNQIRKEIDGMMRDKSLEFGRTHTGAVVGRDSYMILRTHSEIAPRGIPLFWQDDSESGTSSIPTVKSLNDIGVDDLQKIQVAGRIRCGGKTYKIKYGVNKMPEVMPDLPIENWIALQLKLGCLWHASEMNVKFGSLSISKASAPALPPRLPISVTEPTRTTAAPPGNKTISPLIGTIPVFASEEDIGVGDFRQLRRLGQLYCGGVLYRINFDYKDTPKVICKKQDRFSEMLQFRLFELHAEYQQSIALNQTKIPVSLIPESNPDITLPTGAVLDIREPSVPTVESAFDINASHFIKTLTSKKIICQGEQYRVGINLHDEPIILAPPVSDAPVIKVAQARLTRSWIQEKAKQALNCLDRITLKQVLVFDSVFPNTESEVFILREKKGLELVWHGTAKGMDENLNAISSIFQIEILGKKSELIKTFQQLVNRNEHGVEQRDELFKAEMQLEMLSARQNDINLKIKRFEKICRPLLIWARSCTSSVMQGIFIKRATEYSVRYDKYFRLKDRNKADTGLQIIFQNQVRFLKFFDKAQFSLSERMLVPPATMTLKDGTIVKVPDHIVLQQLRIKLVQLLTDPDVNWRAIRRVQRKLQAKNDATVKSFVLKRNAGLQLRNVFGFFLGRDGEGLDPESEKSFYTPETYSRIVTLKGMRNVLLEGNDLFTESEVENLVDQCREHIVRIQEETIRIRNKAKSPDFRGHDLYQPRKNLQQNPINFSDWSNEFQSGLKK